MKYRPRRKPTDFELLLVTEDGSQTVSVSDVSENGVRVKISHGIINADKDIFLELRGTRYPTRIAWAKGFELGLQFDKALPADVHALIARNHSAGKGKRFMMR